MTTEIATITVKQRLDALGVAYAVHDLSRIRLRVYRAWVEQYPDIRLEKVQQQEGKQYFSATAYPVSFAPEIDKVAQSYFDEQIALLLEANMDIE